VRIGFHEDAKNTMSGPILIVCRIKKGRR
jgi:hypothetical protein